MALTTQAALDSVDAAIVKIEAGAQRTTIDTPLGTKREIEYGEIRWLYAERRRLERKLKAEARGGMRVRYGTAPG